jgi:DNA-binding transcriptional ArsR family regulator
LERLESFDCLNADRLTILSELANRELDLGEITRFTKKNRSTTHHHLKILQLANLIIRKKCLKKNWIAGKRTHREVFRFQLTADGKTALNYFQGDNKNLDWRRNLI